MDTIFVLNNHKQVIDVLSNNGSNPSAPFFDDTYKAELDTGAETYEFTTINNPRTNATLEVGNYVLFKYNNKYKLFQIMETTDEHSEGKKLLTVYAEMAGMELLNDYCEPFTVEGNFITFLERVLQDTNWKVGVYSASLLDNIQLVSSTEHKNVYSLIQENLSTFGGVEIEFRVEFIGNQLAALLIDCYASGTRGNRTYRRFEYGEDVKGITRNRNISDLATAVIGQGKNGTHFKDIEWDKTLGNPCNKPLQQNFVVDEEANDLWNNGGKYIKTIYKSDTEDPATLLQETWDYLQEIKQPKFDYDVDLALVAEDYKDINVGDTNYVVDFGYNPPILLEARVGTLELSFADPRDNKCTLTNYKELVSMLTQPVDFNTVGNMIQSHFPIQGEDIAMGAIGEGHINVTYYQAIKADIISAGMAEVNQLLVNKADIQDLTAINASIENLRADKADITDLNAANGNITNLTSQVGQIETVINNHFTGTDAQVLNITAQNTTFDNAVIKDAMIDTVSANKMNTGTLNTNNVNIESEDGGIKISGATQQFKDKEGHVRVQIGKDAQGNFTFCLFSQDGVGILLDETGIKAGAVPDGLIVNDMVSDGANISGSKLDISSVITQINNNETTINSSHIKFDDTGQSLLIAFNTLKNKVDTIEEVTINGDLSSIIEQVNTNTTQIGVNQGKIEALIQNTTITKQDGTVVQLKDVYNQTVNTVNSHTTKIGSLETNYNKVSGDIASVTSKQSTLEQNLDGFKTTVSNTYATKSTVNDLSTNLSKNYSTTSQMNSAINQKANEITSSVSSTYTTKSDFNNLSIGGRNLLKNSNFANGLSNWSYNDGNVDTSFKFNNHNTYKISKSGLTSNKWNGIRQTFVSNAKIGDVFTGSLWYYVEDRNTFDDIFGLELKGQKVGATTDNAIATINILKSDLVVGKWTRITCSVTLNVDMNYIYIYPWVRKNGTIWIADLQVERGNKATDWSPAPEDIDNNIAAVDNKFKKYSTTEQMNSAITQKANEITSTVSNTYATISNFNELSNNLDTNYSTTKEMNSAINQKAGQITNTVSSTYTTKSDFNNLTIGVRNLLKDTKTLTKTGGTGTDSSTKWIVQNTGSEGFKKLYINTTSTNWIECHIPLYSSINTLTQNLTISFEYQESVTGLLVFNFGVFKANGTRIKELTNWVVSSDFKLLGNSEWKRVSFTFNPSAVNNQTDASEYRVQFKKASEKTGECQVRKFKLEIGNKATDWSPAPEDVDSQITTIENSVSIIEQKADSITQKVEKTIINGGVNLIPNPTASISLGDWGKAGTGSNYIIRYVSDYNYVPPTTSNTTPIFKSDDLFGNAEIHCIPSTNYNTELCLCMIIRDCSGKVIMIDGGETTNASKVISYMESLGISHINYYIITHSHSDHAGAASTILNKFGADYAIIKESKWSLLPSVEVDWQTEHYYNTFVNKCKEKGTTILDPRIDTYIKLSDNSNIQIFNSNSENHTDYNFQSLMLLYTYKDNKAFFAGDSIAESALAPLNQVGEVDFLQVGHHGDGNGAEDIKLIDELKPKYAYYASAWLDFFLSGKDEILNVSNTFKRVSMHGAKSVSHGPNLNNTIKFVLDGTDISTTAKTRYATSMWFEKHPGVWYYFKSNGALATNESLVINGKTYNFDSNGVCTNPNA